MRTLRCGHGGGSEGGGSTGGSEGGGSEGYMLALGLYCLYLLKNKFIDIII